MVRQSSFLSLILFLLLVACSPVRLSEQGKMAKAFERAANQLERNRNASASVGVVLAEAYVALQKEDNATLSEIYASSSPERWERAVPVLERLEARHTRVDRILLTSKRIIRMPDLQEADYTSLLVSAKTEAANHLERQAKELLAYAKTGDRFAARDAFGKLEKRRRYAPNTPAILNMKAEAVELGTVYVGVSTFGNVRASELEQIGRDVASSMGSKWVKLSPLGQNDPKQVDLLVEVDIARPFVGPVVNNRSRQTYSNNVTETKKIGVDSTGTALYEEVQITVEAVVTTFSRSRQSEAFATVSVIDPRTNNLIKSREFNGIYLFEDFETDVRGDLRALEGKNVPHLNRSFGACPGDFEMEDAALQALACALPNWNLDNLLGERLLATSN